MKPNLILTAGDGVRRVVVQYDPGDERSAYDLFRRALPAIEELDRVIRSEAQERAAQ